MLETQTATNNKEKFYQKKVIKPRKDKRKFLFAWVLGCFFIFSVVSSGFLLVLTWTTV